MELARYTDSILREQIAQETDAVIITVGASGQEGRDRPDMRMDAEDEAMLSDALRQAKAAGKKTIVLLNVAGPVELSEWIDDIDALLCLYFPGMEGARATADILFGTVSPSGKLPLSYPKYYRDTPTALNFPGEFGTVNYGEGIYVGYRYYDTKGIEPLYPFGFGLSYSRFEVDNACVSDSIYSNAAASPLRVTVRVRNTGNMAASEVVQLYVHACHSTLRKPEKELKAFRKVHLLPGEESTVDLTLLSKDFASYDAELKSWTVEPGAYQLLIGTSSRQIHQIVPVQIVGKNPYGCSLRAPIAIIAEDAEASKICQEILGDWFDPAKLRSTASYFASTKLKVFLNRSAPKYVTASKAWEEKLSLLDARLQEL